MGTLQLDRDSVTVGDPITITMKFAAPEAYRLARVGWSAGADTLVAIDSVTRRVTNDSSWILSTHIALFVPGKLLAGPTDVLLLGPKGDSMFVLFPPESVSVASVLPAGQDSVPPAPYKGLIKPPARIPWWWWAVAAAVLAAAVWFWLRRRKPAAPVRVPLPAKRAPWELAIERLDDLAERKYHARGEPRPFAIALSEIMRLYLEQRFGFLALEQTTSEIAVALKPVDLTTAQKDALLRLLSGCDFAKYANFHWPATELGAALTSARRFVDETIPVMPVAEHK